MEAASSGKARILHVVKTHAGQPERAVQKACSLDAVRQAMHRLRRSGAISFDLDSAEYSLAAGGGDGPRRRARVETRQAANEAPVPIDPKQRRAIAAQIRRFADAVASGANIVAFQTTEDTGPNGSRVACSFVIAP